MLKMRWLMALVLALTFSAVLPVRADSTKQQSSDAAALATQGDAVRGIPACSSCHGANGQGNLSAGFPRLAGLPAAYLLRQMQAFAGGQRSNVMMMPVAKTLSAQEMQAMADYYAAMSIPPTPARHPAPGLLREGAELAQHGRLVQGLPACDLCHGRDGVGVSPAFPPLAGQSAIYIVNQLEAWRHGKRPPGPMGLMAGVANNLSSRDMQAVAAYFSTQSAMPDRETP